MQARAPMPLQEGMEIDVQLFCNNPKNYSKTLREMRCDGEKQKAIGPEP